MSKLIDSGKLTQLIGAIGKRVASTRESIQYAAIQCIGFASVHGDIMHGVRLFENVSKHHQASLVAFLEREGNFAWDKTAKSLVYRKTFAAESFDDARVETLTKGKKWDEYSRPQAVVSMFDVEEQVSKLIKAYENAVKAGKEIKNRGLLDAVLEAKAAYSGSEQDAKTESETTETA
jgi:hypothetical protein